MAYNYGYGAYGYGQQAAAGLQQQQQQRSPMVPPSFAAMTGAVEMGDESGSGGASGVGHYNPRFHFAAAQDAGFDTGGDESQPRTIYVGNLDPSITEEFIGTLFSQIGSVTKSKVIYDGSSDPYAFVEFGDHYTASQALTAMNKRVLLNKEMKVNWATQPGMTQKIDTSKHFHVFVGDLSPEVDNKALRDAFAPFGDVSDAKVIRDLQTLKSKGYGFVSFIKKEEAERAIEQMNGQWLGRRTIRTNWATRKPQGGGFYTGNEQSYDEVFSMTSVGNATVYIGGINPNTSEEDMRKAFSKYGTILEIRIFKQQGYSFVRFDSKESATNAICNMNGTEVNGATVRCSWGRAGQDGSGGMGAQPYSSGYGGGYSNAYSQGYGSGAGTNAQQSSSTAAQQQYWTNYYQQFYNNPQMMQQWQSYWQQQQGGQ